MIVDATICECCDDVTYHIPFSVEDVTVRDGIVCAHLTEEEMTSLYFELKEFKCGLKEPKAYA